MTDDEFNKVAGEFSTKSRGLIKQMWAESDPYKADAIWDELAETTLVSMKHTEAYIDSLLTG